MMRRWRLVIDEHGTTHIKGIYRWRWFAILVGHWHVVVINQWAVAEIQKRRDTI